MTIRRIRNYIKRICRGIWSRSPIVRTASLRQDSSLEKPDETTQIYDSNTYVKEYTYLGIIGEVRDGLCRIEQRNKFSVGEIIEIMKPNGENVEAKVERILNEEGEEQESAPHSKQVLYVALDQKADKYDILRRAEKDA